MKRLAPCAVLAVCMCLSACQFFGPATAEQTLVVQNQVLQTEIAAVRLTATAETDRMMITLEHAQTSVSHVDGQTQDLSATLTSRTGAVVDTSLLSPQAPLTVATPPPVVQNNANPVLQITPIRITPGSSGAQSGVAIQNGADSIQTTQVAAEGSANLTNIVTAEGVDNNDCALSTVTTFNDATNQVYVVATASGIGPNDEVVSRWYHENSEVVNYPWSPGFDIEQACIWFYIDRSEIDFLPGNWSVQLELNGIPVGAAAAFTIASTSSQGDAALEGALEGGEATTP